MDVIKIRRMAYRYARNAKLNHEEAEDIAHDVILKFLTHPKGQLTKHAAIDAMRFHYGDSREPQTIQKIERRAITRGKIPITEYAKTYPVSDYRLMLEQILLATNSKGASLILLRHVYGYDLNEIAEMYGVSQGRACQMVTEAERGVKVNLGLK